MGSIRQSIPLLLFALVMLASCSSSQQIETDPYSSLTKKDLIAKVFEIKKMKESYGKTTLSNLTASFESGSSGSLMFDDQKQEISSALSEIIKEHLSWELIAEDIYYPLYDSLYTIEELKTLIPILESESYKLLVERDLSMISDATKIKHELAIKLMPLFTETIAEIMSSGPEQNPMPSPKRN